MRSKVIRKFWTYTWILWLVLAGCQRQAQPLASPTPPLASQSPAPASPSMRPAATATSTLSPEPTETLMPTPSATPMPEVIIYHPLYAQFEILCPGGQRILIDIYDPAALSQPATAQDILLTTHTHFDHYNEEFMQNFPGQQLAMEEGVIEREGLKITGIASAHNHGDRLLPRHGTNYIYLIETAGLRIAHFGDIGQEQLTSGQLVQLLPLDVAITQFDNPYSDMNMQNQKGFKLIEQIQPRLIIPTHASPEALAQALQAWDGYAAFNQPVHLSAARLQPSTQLLLIGKTAEENGTKFDLKNW